ncbi:photosystem I reaction center subunit VIII [Chlorogloea sp. CCALA 695]|nr:photosystem I reaction center subunit VIII [Chlorogloea sp. CCALA 695]PSB31194.1 photosystem I reaction center subunit VIII [Chlorogloea sp. CCALA 695]
MLFSASYLPSLLVPLTCLVFPAIGLVFMFLYVEREDTVND